jgi:hypothetical protein
MLGTPNSKALISKIKTTFELKCENCGGVETTVQQGNNVSTAEAAENFFDQKFIVFNSHPLCLNCHAWATNK